MSSPYVELGLHDYKYISNLHVSSGAFIILARLGTLFLYESTLCIISLVFYSLNANSFCPLLAQLNHVPYKQRKCTQAGIASYSLKRSCFPLSSAFDFSFTTSGQLFVSSTCSFYFL